ncbi:hypothetical protein [Conchiformibius kuhniae]|uniref:Uncharacterized protein n=1 Tax=Conchiformibius kuhniae TaxID=211502 RepID=A0A8T9N0S6_9NEIS|nr:hypothetical protein [Conchiformibius kuhniae]
MLLRLLPLALLLAACADKASESSQSPQKEQTAASVATATDTAPAAQVSDADIDLAVIILMYNDMGRHAPQGTALLQKANDKAAALLQEFRQNGKIALSTPDFANPETLAEFRIRLNAQADLGQAVFTGAADEPEFHTDAAGKVLRAQQYHADTGAVTRFHYWNGQPFSVEITYPRNGSPTGGRQVYLFRDGKAEALLTEDKDAPAAYRLCQTCLDEARRLYAAKDTMLAAQQRQHHAAAHSVRAARRSIGLIDKRDIPELLQAGDTRSSITLGYDEGGQPEKLYYSHGNQQRIHSYQFYFENGRPVSAQADTIYYRADGSINQDLGRRQKILFDAQGNIAENDTDHPPPERPLSPDTIKAEIQKHIKIAEHYR